MQEIDFHPHALFKMSERDISADEVIEALQRSDHMGPAKRGRMCADKKRGDYWLRVIFEERENSLLVITAYITRRR